jgi:hypothetical protein
MPRVIERRRIDFGAEGEQRFVFHRAAEASPAKATSSIAKARAAAEAGAMREIEKLLADMQRTGTAVRSAAVPAANARLPETLDDILRVHSRIHAAEGSFYRDVIASACEAAGLKVHRIVERALPDLLGALLPDKERSLEQRLKDMGAALGPPWSEDQKLATQAAWTCLGRK